MTPKKAITVYISLPCLLYGVFFVLAVTRYSGMIERNTLYAAHTVFGGYITFMIYTKRDQLTAV